MNTATSPRKISLNCPEDSRQLLEKFRGNGVTFTETTRNALRLFDYVETAISQGSQISTMDLSSVRNIKLLTAVFVASHGRTKKMSMDLNESSLEILNRHQADGKTFAETIRNALRILDYVDRELHPEVDTRAPRRLMIKKSGETGWNELVIM